MDDDSPALLGDRRVARDEIREIRDFPLRGGCDLGCGGFGDGIFLGSRNLGNFARILVDFGGGNFGRAGVAVDFSDFFGTEVRVVWVAEFNLFVKRLS